MKYDATRISDLSERLRARVRAMVQLGEVSERGLAKLTGISQPHVHHVLAGARGMTPAVADRLMEALGITVQDLASAGASAAVEYPASLPAPLWSGSLGAGAPFPSGDGSARSMMFPRRVVLASTTPRAAALSRKETSMLPALAPGDFVLLECSPAVRKRPVFESIYAVQWRRGGYLARCRRVGGRLSCVVDNDRSEIQPPGWISLEKGGILDVVRGRVVWFGREL